MSSDEQTPPSSEGGSDATPRPEAGVENAPEASADRSADAETASEAGQIALLADHADLPDTVHLPRAMHIGEDDSDDRITAKLRSHGVRIGRGMVAPAVFWPSLIVIVAVTAFALIAPDITDTVFTSVNDWIVANLGWYYMLAIGGFIGVALFIGFSKLGTIPLGKDDEKPEFGVLTWFSMLFAAGMGIGLVFYGVAEPLSYATVAPKPGWEGSSEAELAGLAMAQTFVHWGLHPWSIYAVIGLAIAYAIHRRGRPVSIRWALEPLFGERVKGWVGDVIDVLAIFGTVFGVATSLGLGVQQISAGIASIGIVDTVDNTLLVILIIVITFIAMASVVSGIGAGMKWLSNINLSLAGILLISVLLLGPTLFLLQNLTESLGAYLGNVMQMTFDVGAYQRGEATSWFSGWTIFYWGWWISWSPFVGIFIARISRGRTIRQFVAGVLLVPTIVGFIWFSVMGGSGLFRQFFGAGDLVVDGEVDVEGALFAVLQDLPLGTFFSVLAIIVIALFFITSSDSGSLVVDMLASGGHPNPPTWSRVLWSVIEGLVAAALLLAGGLEALQAAALATALPFSIVLLLMAWATIRALRLDAKVRERDAMQERLDRVTAHLTGRFRNNLGKFPELESYVDDRIDYRITRSRGLFAKRDGGQPGHEDQPARREARLPRRPRDGGSNPAG
jgi:choline/glycine/proline betaine transport protein